MFFDFFRSEESKTRKHAANWLEVAERVHHFRRDQLADAQLQQLAAATGELRTRLKEKADASKLKMAIEKLETVLRAVGGRHYPMTSLMENVEFFLVAAIVILGLRAYFVQPFKIPTNSMWPSYYGMTHEAFADGEEPGLLGRAARFAAFGARNYAVAAPTDGEVLVPVFSNLRIAYAEKPGRSFLIFPTVMREYTFSVNGSLVRLDVPGDFDFERVLEERFKGSYGTLLESIKAEVQKKNGRIESSSLTVRSGDRTFEERVYWVPLGKTVKAGEPIVSFDILTGDLLFVDRFTYNFFPPKVGQGFVFKTDNIDSPEMQDARGEQIRQYYIKRLVGVPGDKLEIKAPVLFRNGAPITGADAFEANARKRGLYPGYAAEFQLAPGRSVEVPEHNYYALGDNSPRSKDSRYWGFVPEKDVVGRPLFIYYPLTKRWGIAN